MKMKLKKRGRPLTSVEKRQESYDHWRQNCEMSTDRRNSRHMVKVKQSKLNICTRDLTDPDVVEIPTSIWYQG